MRSPLHNIQHLSRRGHVILLSPTTLSLDVLASKRPRWPRTTQSTKRPLLGCSRHRFRAAAVHYDNITSNVTLVHLFLYEFNVRIVTLSPLRVGIRICCHAEVQVLILPLLRPSRVLSRARRTVHHSSSSSYSSPPHAQSRSTGYALLRQRAGNGNLNQPGTIDQSVGS